MPVQIDPPAIPDEKPFDNDVLGREQVADNLTHLLEIAAVLLRYAEQQYADDIEPYDTHELTWEDLPRARALLEELIREHGDECPENGTDAAFTAPFSAP